MGRARPSAVLCSSPSAHSATVRKSLRKECADGDSWQKAETIASRTQTSKHCRVGEMRSEPRSSLGSQPLLVRGVDGVPLSHWITEGQSSFPQAGACWAAGASAAVAGGSRWFLMAPAAPAWHPEPCPGVSFTTSFLIKQRGYAKYCIMSKKPPFWYYFEIFHSQKRMGVDTTGSGDTDGSSVTRSSSMWLLYIF